MGRSASSNPAGGQPHRKAAGAEPREIDRHDPFDDVPERSVRKDGLGQRSVDRRRLREPGNGEHRRARARRRVDVNVGVDRGRAGASNGDRKGHVRVKRALDGAGRLRALRLGARLGRGAGRDERDRCEDANVSRAPPSTCGWSAFAPDRLLARTLPSTGAPLDASMARVPRPAVDNRRVGAPDRRLRGRSGTKKRAEPIDFASSPSTRRRERSLPTCPVTSLFGAYAAAFVASRATSHRPRASGSSATATTAGRLRASSSDETCSTLPAERTSSIWRRGA
jgi:hypothetical protein